MSSQTPQTEANKRISKSALGSILISREALQTAVANFVNAFLHGEKNPGFALEKVDFVEFESSTDFAVNLFVSCKAKLKPGLELQRNLQSALIAHLETEFKISALSVNVICEFA